MNTYPNKDHQQLIEAISKLHGQKEIASFLRDLLTYPEINEFSQRFQIAKLLWTTKYSYLDIAAKVGTSTTTVTRVSQWLYRESWNGYSVVLTRLYGKSKR